MRIRTFALMGMLTVLAGALIAAAQQESHERPDESRIHRFERQELTVPPVESTGYILDIGGGGEGVIGQINPRQVIAIDLIKQELVDAPAGPLKIVMDARDLKFLDNTFPVATSFFTLMYIQEGDQPKVFQEIHRVLAPGGRFRIWDVILPTKIDPVKDVVIFPFLFHLPGGREVRTGYGVYCAPTVHDLAYFIRLAEAAGFQVKDQSVTGQTFYLELTKP